MIASLLLLLHHRLGRTLRRYADFAAHRDKPALASLLLLTFFVPACAPNEPPPPSAPTQNIVLLTDSSQWATGELSAYKDSLSDVGYRVLVSGYPGESAAELTARLPWLMQPGVDLFLYDNQLAGKAGKDSLNNFLKKNGHPTQVKKIKH